MIQQNYRGDFSIVEKFYRYIDEEKQQVEVPYHLKIEYFTDEFDVPYVVERIGNKTVNCQLSDDGLSLTSHLALSRHNIGCGVLLKKVIEIIDDPSFPDSQKISPHPSRTDIVLIPGISDDDNTNIISEAVLSELRYGYSAYELARANGFEGTVEDWLESLKMKPSQLTETEKQELLAGTDAVRSTTVRFIETGLSEEEVEKLIAEGKQNDGTLYLCKE